jgi:hypothetical protein
MSDPSYGYSARVAALAPAIAVEKAIHSDRQQAAGIRNTRGIHSSLPRHRDSRFHFKMLIAKLIQSPSAYLSFRACPLCLNQPYTLY